MREQRDHRCYAEEERTDELAFEHERAAMRDEREDRRYPSARERAAASDEPDRRRREERDDEAADRVVGSGGDVRRVRPRARDLDSGRAREHRRAEDAGDRSAGKRASQKGSEGRFAHAACG